MATWKPPADLRSSITQLGELLDTRSSGPLLVAFWAWRRSKAELCDRRASPWDDPARRPSHADRRNAWRRHCLASEFQVATAGQRLARKLQHLLMAC